MSIKPGSFRFAKRGIGGLQTPRKCFCFGFFCGFAAKKPKQKRGQGYAPSMGVTIGSVREPGSLTLPFGVGCLRFSTKSKNVNTPPAWVGTLLRAFFTMHKQSPPQVSPVESPHTPPVPKTIMGGYGGGFAAPISSHVTKTSVGYTRRSVVNPVRYQTTRQARQEVFNTSCKKLLRSSPQTSKDIATVIEADTADQKMLTTDLPNTTWIRFIHHTQRVHVSPYFTR